MRVLSATADWRLLVAATLALLPATAPAGAAADVTNPQAATLAAPVAAEGVWPADPEPTPPHFVATDIGTLGGAGSAATAIEGTLVAGNAQTADGDWHGFAYDLGTGGPMVDLGSLGGPNSYVSVISDGVIAGTSETPTGDTRPFTYDTTAADPHMVDLGSVGGPAHTIDMDGTTVVGTVDVDRERHVFVYDIADAHPVMRDLGTLLEPGQTAGYISAEPADIDGPIIVGSSTTATSSEHGFVYDLRHPDRGMVDIGVLGSNDRLSSEAVAVAGNVVVGWSETRNGRRGVLYDLGATEPHMTALPPISNFYETRLLVDGHLVVADAGGAYVYDLTAPHGYRTWSWLGTLGGMLTPAAGQDGLLVGTARTGEAYHAFVLDTDTVAHLHPVDVTPQLPGHGDSHAVAVDGHTFVGTQSTDEVPDDATTHAMVWQLVYDAAPVVRLSAVRYEGAENAGTLRATVVRDGDTTEPATVGYTAAPPSRGWGTGRRATPGDDFTPGSGTVTFAGGQSTAVLEVPVLDDPTSETAESFRIWLHDATGAELGSPSSASAVIAESDLRPDAVVGALVGDQQLLGDGVYDPHGVGQTVRRSVAAGAARTFFAWVTLDPAQPAGQSLHGTVVLHAPPDPRGATVTYWTADDPRDATDHPRQVTAELRSPDGLTVTSWTGPHRALGIRIVIRPYPHTKPGTALTAALQEVWDHDAHYVDTVRATVAVRAPHL